MSSPHPEVPDDCERDHSLLITEAQQRDMVAMLTEIEHDVRTVTFDAIVDTPANRAAAEDHLANLTRLTEQACDAVTNAVAIEERIAHLDFEAGGPRET